MAEIVVPKVFISYSWTSEPHKKWVLDLATRMRDDGANVILDRWHLKEGHDKYKFMEQMVTDPEMSKVLLISDKAYMVKANARMGGVGDESLIMTPEIYQSAEQEKFIPLLMERDEDGKECLPAFVGSRKYVDFCKAESFEEGYDTLIRLIHGQPELKPPLIGQPPKHIFQTRTHVKTAGKVARLKDAVEKEKSNATMLLEEYFETLLEALEDFRLTTEDEKHDPFDDKVIESITAFLPYRDEFIDCMMYVSRHLTGIIDVIHHFLERLIPFQDRPETRHGCRDDFFDNYCFISTELFLYLLAILVKNKRYADMASLIDAPFHHVQNLGSNRYTQSSISAFNRHPYSLEVTRNIRLGGGQTRRISVVGDLVIERATHPKIRFADLFQVDVLLYLRRYFLPKDESSDWFPRLLVYQREGGHLELFAKSTAARGLEPMKQLLRVRDLLNLATSMNKMFQDPGFQGYFNSLRIWHLDWTEMLNFKRIVFEVERQVK